MMQTSAPVVKRNEGYARLGFANCGRGLLGPGARPGAGAARRRVCCARPQCCAARDPLEPVEPGVRLPPVQSVARLRDETAWLARSITAWLDAEWRQQEPAPIHNRIGQRVAQIYERQRLEGEDELSGILLAVGQEMESFDMTDAFVGPFNVANKVADLLLNHRAGPREPAPEYKRDPNAPVWSAEKQAQVDAKRRERRARAEGAVSAAAAADKAAAASFTAQSDGYARQSPRTTPRGNGRPADFSPRAPVSMSERFDRYMFMKKVLDGSVEPEVVSGALALALGFDYDRTTDTWCGDRVSDEFFRTYGDTPPNILEDERAVERLSYILSVDDEDRVREEALTVVIDSLHGGDLAEIQRREGDTEFLRREVVAKYLHMYGGF